MKEKIVNTTKPGNPLWNEHIDERGVSSLEIHQPVKVWEACDNHYFVNIDTVGNYACRKCGFGQKVVWGMQHVKNGKIINL